MPMAQSADSDDQELSRRQREILQFNGDFIRDNGYPPTRREIASGVGLASPSSVAYQVSALKKATFTPCAIAFVTLSRICFVQYSS